MNMKKSTYQSLNKISVSIYKLKNLRAYKALTLLIALNICTLALAQAPSLRVNSNGDLIATTKNSKITVTANGLVDVNGLQADCDGGIAQEKSPSGAKINCVSSSMNIHDHLGNQLQIAGSIARFKLANGEMLTKDGWGQVQDDTSAASDIEDMRSGLGDSQGVEINQDGVRIKGSSISIGEDGISIE
jgi:hypothetical protein